jgi:ribosomal protein S18 acetylase RimI-like enzyme
MGEEEDGHAPPSVVLPLDPPPPTRTTQAGATTVLPGMSAHRDLTRGEGRLRITRWRGDATTAYLAPARGQPTTVGVERSLEVLAGEGYRTAITAALAPAEQAPFLAAGFEVHERLHLLTRGVDELPAGRPIGVTLRRGRRTDRAAILTVDGSAFLPFWHLDGPGLDDALGATPSARLRVAHPEGRDTLTGYAITGRAGSRGYLQRLAVDPIAQRRGIGAALVVDGLRWLRRWGAHEVLVNTQVDNRPALALYEALGFRRQANGLAVLRRDLDAAAS